ncbi:unnamed protein product [Adineta ricciae]|uniref:Uncharacterized protein n=1 Tax=Adineta ricciae TaxID=249248 RepID=A0A815UXP1_ADIRI|nr:unnamed protein product [Adineta ricciae]CAF1618882.1 unnamed protein product [Adineta ricciae]
MLHLDIQTTQSSSSHNLCSDCRPCDVVYFAPIYRGPGYGYGLGLGHYVSSPIEFYARKHGYNKTLSPQSSINDCIRLCNNDYHCQTAVYFKDATICSMYAEICQKDSIKSSENISATVICSKKNNPSFPTCSSTAISNQETTSNFNIITSTEQYLRYDLGSFWSFDNNTNDSLSNFNGIPINSPIYQTPGINGYGSALLFNLTIEQYVNISNTYLSMDDDYGLFVQHQSPSTDQTLHYIIRNFSLYMGFYSDDLRSSTMIQLNTWYHVAFVYDYSLLQQSIYLDGILDCKRTSSGPYKGTSGAIIIGKAESCCISPRNFSGAIDEVSLKMKAKNASEILDDATLVTYHSFDYQSYYDSSSLHLKGKYTNVTFVNGRMNKAIHFQSNLSLYQIDGFILLGISNKSYSITLWIYPELIQGSILLQETTKMNGHDWCIYLLGFSSNGQIVGTIWNGSLEEIIGPILPNNVWSHVVYTYSRINGLQLYVNGTLINSTNSNLNYIGSEQVTTLILGNSIGNISCNSQSIISNVYNGSIDEFRVYSRELNNSEIFQLANP